MLLSKCWDAKVDRRVQCLMDGVEPPCILCGMPQHPNFKENEMNRPESIMIDDVKYVREDSIASRAPLKMA